MKKAVILISVILIIIITLYSGTVYGAATEILESETTSKMVQMTEMQKKELKYTDIVYVNDFKIVVCAWLFVFNYSESIKILKEHNYIQTILSTLPDTKEIEAFKSLIMQRLTA